MKKVVRKRTGGLLPALIWGAGVALGVSFLLTAIFAYAMAKEWIGEKSVGFIASAILILAAGGGALLASGMYPQRRMLVCLAAAGVYFLFLLLGAALFFGGDFRGLPVTAALVCGSAVAAGLIGAKSAGGRKKKYKRYRI